jgi:hypothetical protein
MMESPSAENYTVKLLNRLYSLYNEYIRELQIIHSQLEKSSVEVLETFINIEQHRFRQINSIEKVLNTHYQGCSESFVINATEKLMVLRVDALKQSREVRSKLSGQMTRIRSELSSIRLPGRAKNYRRDSVPVLIDIET